MAFAVIDFPKGTERVVITGWPKTGKTTLAAALGGGRSTDELIEILEAEKFPKSKRWSETSLRVSNWFDAKGPWLIEGVAVPRALRKWKEAHPGKRPPVDRLILLKEPHLKLDKGQQTMGKGLDTVLNEILPWLKKHVTVVQLSAEQLPSPKAKVRSPKNKSAKSTDTAADIGDVMNAAKKEVVTKDTPKSSAKTAKKSEKPNNTPATKKSTAKKKRAVGRSPRDEMIITERQELVYQLYRRHGASIREISRILEEKGHGRCSRSTIGRDLQAAIQGSSLRRDLSRDEMLDTLVDGVRDIQAAFAQKALKEKDVQAGKLLLDCSKEIDRLTGTSKNSQADSDAKAALAKLFGLNPEDLPDERDSV